MNVTRGLLDPTADVDVVIAGRTRMFREWGPGRVNIITFAPVSVAVARAVVDLTEETSSP